MAKSSQLIDVQELAALISEDISKTLGIELNLNLQKSIQVFVNKATSLLSKKKQTEVSKEEKINSTNVTKLLKEALVHVSSIDLNLETLHKDFAEFLHQQQKPKEYSIFKDLFSKIQNAFIGPKKDQQKSTSNESQVLEKFKETVEQNLQTTFKEQNISLDVLKETIERIQNTFPQNSQKGFSEIKEQKSTSETLKDTIKEQKSTSETLKDTINNVLNVVNETLKEKNISKEKTNKITESLEKTYEIFSQQQTSNTNRSDNTFLNSLLEKISPNVPVSVTEAKTEQEKIEAEYDSQNNTTAGKQNASVLETKIEAVPVILKDVDDKVWKTLEKKLPDMLKGTIKKLEDIMVVTASSIAAGMPSGGGGTTFIPLGGPKKGGFFSRTWRRIKASKPVRWGGRMLGRIPFVAPAAAGAAAGLSRMGGSAARFLPAAGIAAGAGLGAYSLYSGLTSDDEYKGTEKIVARAGLEGAGKAVTKKMAQAGLQTGAKTAAVAAGKAGATAAVGKGLGKSLLTKIPFIGAFIGLGFAFDRWSKGDIWGGFVDVMSGIASIFPGIGTGISFALDGLNAVGDIKSGGIGDKQKNEKKGSFLLAPFKWIGKKVYDGLKSIWLIGPLIKAFEAISAENYKEAVKQFGYMFPPFEIIGSLLGDTKVSGVTKGVTTVAGFLLAPFKWIGKKVYDGLKSIWLIGPLIKAFEAIGTKDYKEAVKQFAYMFPPFEIIGSILGDNKVSGVTKGVTTVGGVIAQLGKWLLKTAYAALRNIPVVGPFLKAGEELFSGNFGKMFKQLLYINPAFEFIGALLGDKEVGAITGTVAGLTKGVASIIGDLSAWVLKKVWSVFTNIPVIGPLLKAGEELFSGNFGKMFKQLLYINPAFEFIGALLGDEEVGAVTGTVAGLTKGIGSWIADIRDWMMEKMYKIPFLGNILKGFGEIFSGKGVMVGLKTIGESFPLLGAIVSFFDSDIKEEGGENLSAPVNPFQAFKEMVLKKAKSWWKNTWAWVRWLARRVLPTDVIEALDSDGGSDNEDKENAVSAKETETKVSKTEGSETSDVPASIPAALREKIKDSSKKQTLQTSDTQLNNFVPRQSDSQFESQLQRIHQVDGKLYPRTGQDTLMSGGPVNVYPSPGPGPGVDSSQQRPLDSYAEPEQALLKECIDPEIEAFVNSDSPIKSDTSLMHVIVQDFSSELLSKLEQLLQKQNTFSEEMPSVSETKEQQAVSETKEQQAKQSKISILLEKILPTLLPANLRTPLQVGIAGIRNIYQKQQKSLEPLKELPKPDNKAETEAAKFNEFETYGEEPSLERQQAINDWVKERDSNKEYQRLKKIRPDFAQDWYKKRWLKVNEKQFTPMDDPNFEPTVTTNKESETVSDSKTISETKDNSFSTLINNLITNTVSKVKEIHFAKPFLTNINQENSEIGSSMLETIAKNTDETNKNLNLLAVNFTKLAGAVEYLGTSIAEQPPSNINVIGGNGQSSYAGAAGLGRGTQYGKIGNPTTGKFRQMVEASRQVPV